MLRLLPLKPKVERLLQIWEDILLRWDPDEYGGVQHVRVPTSLIWTPDIVLYN